jgi:hypothetical protein
MSSSGKNYAHHRTTLRNAFWGVPVCLSRESLPSYQR